MNKWDILRRTPKQVIRLGALALLVVAWVVTYHLAFYLGQHGLGVEFALGVLILTFIVIAGRKL